MFTKLRGRKGRLAGIVAAIPLALGLVVAAAQPAAAAGPIRYVALGDSYTAGQGAGGEEPVCFRSPGGYPTHVHNLAAYDLLANRACQASTTASVLTQQLPARPDLSVGLVTLTIGGNDAGFDDLVPTCGPDPTGPACAAVLTITPEEARALFTALVKTYWTVKAKFPAAKVVVLSYPRLFAPGFQAPGFPPQLASAVNSAGDILNGIIASAAKVSPVTFVEVRDEFSGHEIGSAAPWINFGTDPIRSLHPNAAGYRYGYFQALVNDRVVPAR